MKRRSRPLPQLTPHGYPAANSILISTPYHHELLSHRTQFTLTPWTQGLLLTPAELLCLPASGKPRYTRSLGRTLAADRLFLFLLLWNPSSRYASRPYKRSFRHPSKTSQAPSIWKQPLPLTGDRSYYSGVANDGCKMNWSRKDYFLAAGPHS